MLKTIAAVKSHLRPRQTTPRAAFVPFERSGTFFGGLIGELSSAKAAGASRTSTAAAARRAGMRMG